MAFSRIYAPGWGSGDPFASAQANALDIQLTNALDKRTGQADTLGSVVTCTAGTAGRIIPAHMDAANADTTYTMANGIGVLRVSSISALRNYILSTTGAVTGDKVAFMFQAGTTFPAVIKNNAGTILFQLGDGSRPDDDGPYAEFVFNVADWILANQPGSSRTHSQTFTSSGTWVCPRGVFFVDLEGFGGGGGGAGGTSGGAANIWSNGGGGGGAAQKDARCNVPVTPGTSYTVTVGSVGSGGVPDAGGGTGGDTTFGALATFVGAAGGNNYTTINATTFPSGGLILGGSPNRRTFGLNPILFTSLAIKQSFAVHMPQGQGGYGSVDTLSDGTAVGQMLHGGPSNGGFTGGGPGSAGTDSGTTHGGGAGGGGGAGFSASGGAGGSGGNGNAAGNGTNGANGTAVAANTGAGGGGGGGGGSASGSPGTGGSGGAGGSGLITVRWVK